MPRRPRIQQQAICYHLYNRCINRDRLFEDERDFARFRQIIGRYKQRCACLVYHWALMPNHYHLLIRLTFPMLRPFAAGIQQCSVRARRPGCRPSSRMFGHASVRTTTSSAG